MFEWNSNARLIRKFPWKIFLRFFSIQLIGYNLLLIVLLSSLYYSQDFKGEDLQIYQGLMLKFCLIYFVMTIFFALWTSYRFCTPLQRMLLKALTIARKKPQSEFYHENIFVHDYDEYSELELAFNRIDRKYVKKKEQLQREREENQAFMSSVQEGLVSISREGQLLYFNSQFASLFIDHQQFQSHQISGFPLNLMDVLRVPEIIHAYKRVLETGKIEKFTVKINTRLTRQLHFFAVSMAPLIKEKSKDLYSVIGIFHDITDIKMAEQIRIEFVGNASHELRTPLTSIKGYIETIRGDFQENRVDHIPKFLGIVSRNVDRLIDLVNDLLSLSTLDSNPALKLEEISALHVSEVVVSELNFLASEKEIKIFVQGDVPNFNADIRKVEQVLRNLVSNAIKYIGMGGEVRIIWDLTEDGQIRLRVADNGPGISEEHLPRLFERFYRIDRGRAREAGGTGLGLAIVKHIMQSHGGSVQVLSKIGEGSQFVCLFPKGKIISKV